MTKLVNRRGIFAMCTASGAGGFAAVVLFVINTLPGR